MTVPALRVREVSKTFGPTKALDAVSFEVGHGEIHALLGGNGSGKSTLIKILAGVYHADPGGTLEFDGRAVEASSTSPTLARENRLRFVHQDPGLFGELTVADNVAMRAGYPTRGGAIRKRDLHRRVRELLNRFEIDARPGDKLGDLRPADQTMVAIARALDRGEGEDDPSLLVLDEPTASLPQGEVEVLLAALRRRAQAGQGIVYVSHRIDEVLTIADSVTVLRDGRHIVTRETAGLTEATLTEYIAGRPIERLFGERATMDAPRTDVVLSVRDLAGGPLNGVGFDLHEGEILGIAGLLGSGRTELLRMIFGAIRPDRGVVRLAGRDIPLGRSPSATMRRGVAYVPEDRTLDAAFADLTVQQNLSMAQVPKYRRLGRIASRPERRDAVQSIRDFGIRPPREWAVFSTLSGGNQQKVILARWMRRDPVVLLLDEPTQGVDVGARADVYEAIRRATVEGMAVILVSSDFEELVHASDRVLVLQDGVIAGELPKDRLDKESLIYMTYTGKEAAS